jgi:hypothetical protein
MTTRFGDALRGYLDVVRTALGAELSGLGKVVVVRDLRGRLRLVIEKRPPLGSVFTELEQKLALVAGAFAGGGLLWGDDLLAPSAIFQSVDLHLFEGVALLERTAMGADWTRPPLPNLAPTPPRATLYGIKGGVGRSLALCVWARHLAQLGQKVLVVDLDLESPGVSTSLLPADAGASFGIVDWLIEDAVGQADEELVRLMVAPSPLADGTSGSILVAPCSGSSPDDDSYLAKLARAYLDLPQQGGGVETFADRLARMLDGLESEHQPDVVLLDSRAGLHDVAAITLTRLSSMSFLFAMGTAQTWAGYRTLFRQWQRQPEVGKRVRDRLRVVAAQVPETGRDAYLSQFEQDAYDLFADTLYEKAGPENPDAFNFDIRASDAPHHRLPIYWSRALQDWNPLRNTVSDEQLQGAFGGFLRDATELLVDPPQAAADGDFAGQDDPA